MKTKIIIEVETPDNYCVWSDCEKAQEDYTEEELSKFQKEYSEDLHKAIVRKFTDLEDVTENIEESLCEGELENFYIEQWETLEDYKIKLSAEVMKNE